VKSWTDVMVGFLNVIANFEPEKFETIAQSFPRKVYKDDIGSNPRQFQLENGYYANVNMGAEEIERFCFRSMEKAEITADEYYVTCDQSETEGESATP